MKKKIDLSKYPEKGLFETRYWVDRRKSKPITKGFPWSETGNIEGAVKACGKGLASKVQSINRQTGEVRWTAIRGRKIPGVNIYPVDVVKGDKEGKPS
jgi:hypothetical protein